MNTYAEIAELYPSDAQDLLDLIAGESDDYLRYTPNFRSSPQTLADGLRNRQADRWWGFLKEGELVGFFMLRGLDEGYKQPAFGVFVAESASKAGLATRALAHALAWCESEGIGSVMLKVDPANHRARQIYLREGFKEIRVCPATRQQIMEKQLTTRWRRRRPAPL
ncbi:MAG: GCN5-related N-acetyltransferase [Chthoniobacteraceae bacterium]|nr:GCN5-related N-acetyltransferase [Chthoniobacteraceae bacterium]